MRVCEAALLVVGESARAVRLVFFFFSSRRRHTRLQGDWSSDVCSSDLGKSTVAVNLAVTLSQTGGTVGIIDSDVYGPDVPLMLGARGRPGMFENRIIPVEVHGLKMMSIGLLVNEREPLVWRGPMIHSFIQQMLRDVMWGALDYLVFDMPPGTGDAQLSLSQVIPLDGVVMVT